MNSTAAIVIADTRAWLEKAVIGLNLCPFAKSVHVKGQIHFAVSEAGDEAALLDDLRVEIESLVQCDPAQRETTLLMAPLCLQDFLDFNDFLGQAERLIRRMKLEGVLQLASFHPRYQFSDTEQGDITNFTNRSPYPTLHLLREESIDRAVQSFPESETIYETNLETLRRLGHAGWDALALRQP